MTSQAKNHCVLQNKIFCEILLTEQDQAILLKFTTQFHPMQKYISIGLWRPAKNFSSVTELSVSINQFHRISFVLQFALKFWEGRWLIAFCCSHPSTILPAVTTHQLPFSIGQNVLPFLILSTSSPPNTKRICV